MVRMKIFLSFSGDLSNKIAEATKVFLETVVPNIELFLSSVDISNGEIWQKSLINELSKCRFGLFILTRDNQDSAWIHFEAGALSKGDPANPIVPICFGFPIDELDSPIKIIYQGFSFEKKKMIELVHKINAALEPPIKDKNLEEYISAFWDKYEDAVNKAIEENEKEIEPEDGITKVVKEVRINRTILRDFTSNFNNKITHIQLKKPPQELMDDLISLTLHYANFIRYDSLKAETTRITPKKKYREMFLSDLYFLIKGYNLLKNSPLDQEKTLKFINQLIQKLKTN